MSEVWCECGHITNASIDRPHQGGPVRDAAVVETQVALECVEDVFDWAIYRIVRCTKHDSMAGIENQGCHVYIVVRAIRRR